MIGMLHFLSYIMMIKIRRKIVRRLIGIILVILIYILGAIGGILIFINLGPGVFDYEYKVGMEAIPFIEIRQM